MRGYLYIGGNQALPTSIAKNEAGGDTVTAVNTTGSAITAGDKVWVEPVSQNYTFTSTSGENAITTSPFRFTSTGTSGSLNALISNNTTSIGSSSVEVQIKYKINRAPENYLFLASIFGKNSQGLDYQNGNYNGMTYRITTGDIAMWTISNWNQYGASNISSKVGNWIWDKFILTANSSSSTTFLTQNSTDGINWTNGSSFTSSFNLFNNLFENLVRFGINTTVGSEFIYELDLNETYVKVDGQIVWKANTGGYAIKDFDSPVCYNFGFASDSSGNFPSIDSEYKASNFSSSKYITYPAFIRNRSKATYYHKFYTGSISSSSGCIYEYNSFDALYIDNGNLRTYNWSSGQNVIILNSISSNTVYYIKVVVDIPKREYYYSTDGITYVKAIEISDTWMSLMDSPVFVGRNYSGSYSFYFSGGYIDLSGEYAEDADGNVIWSALSVPNITKNFLTGVAQENIAVNATGTVKTVLE